MFATAWFQQRASGQSGKHDGSNDGMSQDELATMIDCQLVRKTMRSETSTIISPKEAWPERVESSGFKLSMMKISQHHGVSSVKLPISTFDYAMRFSNDDRRKQERDTHICLREVTKSFEFSRIRFL